MRLKDRVALITGGTSGIGRATAMAFAREGAVVAFTGRRRELGRAVAEEIRGLGREAAYLPADHTRREDCERSVSETLAAFGRIDVLFNNAGIVPAGTAESTDEETWAETMALNITAVWRMSRLVIPHMRTAGGGVIVNNGSDWAMVGGRSALAYCASKGAVVQMTKAMALDHAREGIRVNAVCPGDTFVERWTAAGYQRGGEGSIEAKLKEMGEALPLGRVARAEEVARAVVFLASDDSSFVTGTTLLVDGGNTAQ